MLGTAKTRSRRRCWTPSWTPTHANAFVIAAVEKFWPPFDHREMHDVFIVISEGSGGEHIVRTVYAADEDDARQTHQENYADEPIVAVHQ